MLARSEAILVKLDGPPQGKGRLRYRIVRSKANPKGYASGYTPAKTRSYEADLKEAAQKAMADRAPIEGAVTVTVVAVFEVPPSWSKRKKAEAHLGLIFPTVTPDWENIAKVCDAFNKVVWRDDAQVVGGHIHKRYRRQDEAPSLEIEVKEI